MRTYFGQDAEKEDFNYNEIKYIIELFREVQALSTQVLANKKYKVPWFMICC